MRRQDGGFYFYCLEKNSVGENMKGGNKEIEET